MEDRTQTHSLDLSSITPTPRQAVLATLTVLIVAACFALVWRFQGVLFSFIVALMLHIAVKPLIERLRRRGVKANASLWMVYGAVFALLAAFIALIVPFMAEQMGTIVGRVPEYYANLRQALQQSGVDGLIAIARALPTDVLQLQGMAATPSAAAAPAPTGESQPALASAMQAINGLVVFIAIFLMAVYWTLDGDRLVFGVLMRMPESKRESARELIAEMEAKVGAFYRGQLVLCLFVGVLSTVAYLVIGLPYALVLGMLAFVFEAVPMIGPALGAIPALIIALAIAPEKALFVLIATVIIQQVENNVLVPRVMDRAVGVNPIVSIIAIAGFSVVFGLAGALLAIPLAAIIQIIINRLLFRATPVSAETAPAPTSDLQGQLQQTGGRDKASVLRMEARELAQDVRKQLRDAGAASGARDEHIEDLIEAIAIDLDALLARQDAPDPDQPEPVRTIRPEPAQ